jgi:serine/threonine protein kinase
VSFDEKQREKINLRVGDERGDGETASGDGKHVKVLNPQSADTDAFFRRLKVEIEAANNLAHPSIVPIMEIRKRGDGTPYVVTERIDDPTFFDLLHSSANISKTDILGHLIGACEALAHAHANGVVHRKLSADKIFISSSSIDGATVRVTGFGTGWIGDARKADPRIDVLAFGMLLQDAFSGKQTPPEVENIISFCAAEHAVERYADCREVLENLLLVNQGKLPNPPKARPGQAWMKPPAIAAIVAVAIAITAIVCVQTKVFQPSVAILAKPAMQAIKAEIKKQTEDTASHESPQFTADQAREKYGLNDNATSHSDPKLLSKEGLKGAATTAAAVGAATYQSLTPEQKAKAQKAATNGAVKALHKWQTMDSNSKEKLKNEALGAVGKAKSLWQKLPNH